MKPYRVDNDGREITISDVCVCTCIYRVFRALQQRLDVKALCTKLELLDRVECLLSVYMFVSYQYFFILNYFVCITHREGDKGGRGPWNLVGRPTRDAPPTGALTSRRRPNSRNRFSADCRIFCFCLCCCRCSNSFNNGHQWQQQQFATFVQQYRRCQSSSYVAAMFIDPSFFFVFFCIGRRRRRFFFGEWQPQQFIN